MKLNREKNKDTFMDRSWRERIEKEGTAAEEPGLSRWQKFIRGGYSFTALGRGFAEKLSIKQKKVEFIDSLIEKRASYPEERDRLLIRQLEVKVLNTFNMYRIPFIAGSMGFCLAFFFRSPKPLPLRLLPLIFLGSFSSLYNYQIG
jgi:hypothetical protein